MSGPSQRHIVASYSHLAVVDDTNVFEVVAGPLGLWFVGMIGTPAQVVGFRVGSVTLIDLNLTALTPTIVTGPGAVAATFREGQDSVGALPVAPTDVMLLANSLGDVYTWPAPIWLSSGQILQVRSDAVNELLQCTVFLVEPVR